MPCGFLHVLVPDVAKIEHHNTYSSKALTGTDTCIVSPPVPATSMHNDENYTTCELSHSEIAVRKKSFCVNTALQHKIRENEKPVPNNGVAPFTSSTLRREFC